MKLFLLSFTVACAACIITLFTLNKYGITWDEPIFFYKADGYIQWMLRPKYSSIYKYWNANSDDIHPPLRQFLTGMTKEVFFNRLQLLDVTRAYRVSALFFVFSGIFFLTYYAGLRYGVLTGLFCGIGLFLTPQIFYLANIASMDFAIGVMWFLCILSVLLFKTTRTQAIVSGICIGLTMLTKFNGVFLFVPVIGYMVYSLFRLRKNTSIIILPAIVILIAFGLFFLLWPWLWINPIGNLFSFFYLQSRHMGPMVWFMNKLYINGPPQYPFILFMISTPLIILIPFCFGIVTIIRKGTMEERFLVLNALYPFVLLLTIATKKYDGIRQMLPAYPFVILVAAIGLRRFVTYMRKFQQTTILIISLLVGLSIYHGLIRIHPYQSAYYNELVGGIRGAHRLGFESDYWGSPYLNILPWMNKHKDKTFCVFPTTNPFYYYLAMGYLEPGVIFNDAPETCDYLVVLMRQGYIYQYPNIVNLISQKQYEYAVSVDSIPLVAAYALPRGTKDIFIPGKQE